MASGGPMLRGAAVWIELAVHEVHNEPSPSELPDESCLEFARKKKAQGNRHLSTAGIASAGRAARRYAAGVEALEKLPGQEAAELLTQLRLNGALANLRRENWTEAMRLCEQVLKKGPEVKAFFRRSAALQQLGRLEEAAEDLRSAVKLSDDPALRKELAKVQALRKKKEEEEKRNFGGVFDKMKQQDKDREKKEQELAEKLAKE
ncbi:unnamed protein product, partial [Effrenium voratum]